MYSNSIQEFEVNWINLIQNAFNDIQMELNFHKVHSFFHQWISWLSLVMHNNAEAKFKLT
jgi:hypothetical protein